MDNNIDKQIQKLEELQKLYESEYFEKHNAFAIAIIQEIKKMIVSKNESLHLVSQREFKVGESVIFEGYAWIIQEIVDDCATIESFGNISIVDLKDISHVG